ncbi:hypothetical protein Bbelb_289960 [Branchiostoma belcheri]|nr:hypothetical protein Bbelb_289960 [Branchiostoma belcheri]
MVTDVNKSCHWPGLEGIGMILLTFSSLLFTVFCATNDARNRSRPDLACRPHSYTLCNRASDVKREAAIQDKGKRRKDAPSPDTARNREPPKATQRRETPPRNDRYDHGYVWDPATSATFFLKTWGRSDVDVKCKSVVCTPSLAVSGCVHRSLRKCPDTARNREPPKATQRRETPPRNDRYDHGYVWDQGVASRDRGEEPAGDGIHAARLSNIASPHQAEAGGHALKTTTCQPRAKET